MIAFLRDIRRLDAPMGWNKVLIVQLIDYCLRHTLKHPELFSKSFFLYHMR